MKKAEVAKVGQFVRHHRHQSLASGVCLNIGQIRRVIYISTDGDVKVRKNQQGPSPYIDWTWMCGDYEILPPEEATLLLLSGEI